MSKSDLDARPGVPAFWRYGLSVLSVAISTALTVPLQAFDVRVSLFFPAVLLATWFGGTGPGLFAVLLSTFSINFFFTEPQRQFQFGIQDIPNLVAFLFAALLISAWSAARKRTENRLRESEQRWHGLTEALPQLVWGATADGACDYFSTQWTDYTGVPETELLGWQWMKVLHPDDREPTRTFWTDSVAGRAPYDVEYRVQSKDGNYGWFKTRGVPIRDEKGNIEKWFGTCTDITDRKQAEASLRESETELRKARDELEAKVKERTAKLSRANEELQAEIIERKSAQENLRRSEAFLAEGQRISHTGSWSWSISTGKVTWSEEHFRIFGFDPARTEPSLDLFLERVHPEDRQFIERSLHEAVGDRSDFDLEFRIALADGSIKHVQGVGRPVFKESGEIDRYNGTTVDISERKRGEALFAGEKRLLEMIATGVALEQILNSLCVIIEEYRAGTLASVLLLLPDGIHLDSAAGPSLPQGWRREMEKLPIGPCAGSCGTAAYRGAAVIVSDIATDPLWEVPEHRAAALSHGLRASWSNPILSSEGKVLGTFCIYGRETRSPSAQDFGLMEKATHLARVAIERDRAEEALRASEQVARGQVEALAQSLDVLTTAPDPEKFIGQMLSTIGRLLNAQNVTLWLFDEESELVSLRSSMANGGRPAAADPEHPFMKDPLFWKENAVVQELQFTAGPVVCDDVATDPRVPGEWREHLERSGTRRFLAVPLLVGGQVRGFVSIRHTDVASYRPEEIELTQALAHQVMLALQLNEFAEQGQRAAVFEERNRMARDIHDTLAQGFTGVIVQLEAAEDAISCGSRKEADAHLRRAGDLARRSLSEARRSVHALRPHALQEHNFWEALKGMIKNTTVGTALHTKCEAQGKIPQLPQPWQENLLHIGQEALTNTLKYAHARNFETRLSYQANELRLELRDDGDGFRPKDRHDGVGHRGMRERVEQMGGELKIASSRGNGTKITVLLPCNGESTS
jgi:PAS domain S-box-containing protein